MKEKDSITLNVDQDGWTGKLQLSIGDRNGGYRICGPKYNGSSKNLLTRLITKQDAAEIRRCLDKAYPIK